MREENLARKALAFLHELRDRPQEAERKLRMGELFGARSPVVWKRATVEQIEAGIRRLEAELEG